MMDEMELEREFESRQEKLAEEMIRIISDEWNYPLSSDDRNEIYKWAFGGTVTNVPYIEAQAFMNVTGWNRWQ